MTDPNSITAKQLIVYIVSTQIGLGVWTISANLAKSAGHDGWIALIAAGLAMTVLSVGIILLLKRYPEQNILEINRHLFGRFAGTVLNVIFLLYIIGFAAFEVRGFTEIVRILFMPLTPPLVLSCILLIPTLYLTWHGLNAVCKFSQTIFLFLSLIILLAISLHGQLQPTFLQPVGAAGFKKIAKASAITTFLYLGPELVPFIYPYISDKRPALKYTVYANFLTTFFYTSLRLARSATNHRPLATTSLKYKSLPSHTKIWDGRQTSAVPPKLAKARLDSQTSICVLGITGGIPGNGYSRCFSHFALHSQGHSRLMSIPHFHRQRLSKMAILSVTLPVHRFQSYYMARRQ